MATAMRQNWNAEVDPVVWRSPKPKSHVCRNRKTTSPLHCAGHAPLCHANGCRSYVAGGWLQSGAPPPALVLRSRARDKEARDAILDCWHWCGQNDREAVRLFKRRHADLHISRPDKLLAKWKGRGSTTDAARKPRRRKVPEALAKEAAAIYERGWPDGRGQYHGFDNVKDACNHDERFKALFLAAKCSPATMLSAMKCVRPALGTVPETVKPTLANTLMLERRRAAGDMLRVPRGVLEQTQWMDEWSMGMDKLGGRVWGDKTKGERLLVDSRAPRSQGNRTWLHACIAINACKGAALLVWLTGTKGLKGKRFKVCAVPLPPRAPLTACPASPPACRPGAQARQSAGGGRCTT